MLKSWSIQNFKPILDSGELQLKPVTILAGRNSSGKSSLIQSILMIAQTLSNPLPARALIPHGDIVKLGTIDDVLSKISDLRTISIGFELTSRDEIGYEGIKGMYDEYRTKLLAVFHVDERDKRFSILEAPEAVLDSLSLISSYSRYALLNELEISDEIRQLFPENCPEEDIISMHAGLVEIYFEFIVKQPTDDEVLNLMENTSIRIQRLILREKKPIYQGRFSTSFSPLDSEINTNSQNMTDGSPTKEDISYQDIVGLSHFLPVSLINIAPSNEENIGPFSLLPVEFINSMEEITRFFSSQIRYLSPLRLDPDRTQRTFAPTSQMDDVGFKGEYAAVVYHNNQLAQIDWYNPNTEQVQQSTLQEALNIWANYLDIASQITTEAAGNLGVAWRVVTKKGQPPRTLSEVGVGMSQILPILVMGLLAPEGTLLIMEQPELHLHPGVQARLGDFFMGLAQCGKQCLIETHSENLISQLRYHIVQAGGMEKSDCIIYFVDQDNQGAAKFEKVEISAKGNILNWPDGFFDETMLQEGRITTASLRKRAKEASNE